MARRFPSRGRPFARSRRGGRQSQSFWSAEAAILAVPFNGLQGVDIYNGEIDAELNSFLETEATVQRILGRGHVRATDNGISVVVMALFRADNIIGATAGARLDPGIVQNLTDEDCLWYDMRTVHSISGTNVYDHHWEMDVRVKRRLETKDRLFFVASNTVAINTAPVAVDCMFRILSKLNV